MQHRIQALAVLCALASAPVNAAETHVHIINFDKFSNDGTNVPSSASGVVTHYDTFLDRGDNMRVGSSPSGAAHRSCVRNDPALATSGLNYLIGAKGTDDTAICDATMPLNIALNGSQRFVGFFIVGKNPKGWLVKALNSQNNVLVEKTVKPPEGNPTRASNWASVSDPKEPSERLGHIQRVLVMPALGSDPTVQLGIDDVVFSD